MNVTQILVNYARVSRGPWRLKGLIDRAGHPVTSRFITIRPLSPHTIEYLWALLNSPIANAYAFTHLTQRDNVVGNIRHIPVPVVDSANAVCHAASEYLAAAQREESSAVLQQLLLEVDAEVLKLYALPTELERAVLDLFTGYPRVGVPFQQEEYLPGDLGHPIRLTDFLQFERDWGATNRGRSRLIDKKLAGTISADEQTRLDAFQAYADHYLERVVPRPTHELDDLEARITASAKDG
jgi:hypothetical protein